MASRKSISVLLSFNEKLPKLTAFDFEIRGVLGKGSFGRVYLASINRHHVALKVIKKSIVENRKLWKYVRTERSILARLCHPFIVDFKHAF